MKLYEMIRGKGRRESEGESKMKLNLINFNAGMKLNSMMES